MRCSREADSCIGTSVSTTPNRSPPVRLSVADSTGVLLRETPAAHIQKSSRHPPHTSCTKVTKRLRLVVATIKFGHGRSRQGSRAQAGDNAPAVNRALRMVRIVGQSAIARPSSDLVRHSLPASGLGTATGGGIRVERQRSRRAGR